MKKVLVFIFAFLMLFTTLNFIACGDNEDLFGGKYEEISEKKAFVFINAVYENEELIEEFNIKSGNKLYYKASGIVDGKTREVELDLKMLGSEFDSNLFLMSGNMKVNMSGKEENSNIYYDGTYFYAERVLGGNSIKTREKQTKNQLLNYMDFEEITEHLIDQLYIIQESEFIVSYSMKEKDKDIFIKIVFDGQEDNTITSGSIYLQFDADMTLKGYKMDAKSNKGNDSLETKLSFIEWEGKIEAPKNLSEYIENK